MRYTSPRIQLTLVATVLVLTTVFRRLVDTYLLHATIVDENLSYDRNLSTGIVGCLSGVVGIFLVNLAGIRSMFVLYTLTNILYAISIVVQYHGGGSTFHQVAQVLNAAGYDLGRVATLVIVLAYMREIWKARAVAIFLILEYSSITIGNLIAIHSNDSDSKRSYVAIAFLCVSCLAPFFAVAIAPSENVYRDDGVYMISPPTTLVTESKQLVLIFKNKYMLLLIPYMFAYPFAFGTANVTLKITQTIVLFDVGKILVILMGQLLDVQWTGRRKRSLVALALLVIIFIVSGALTVYVRAYKYVFSSIYQSWSPAELEQYMSVTVYSQTYRTLLPCLFFGGMASGFFELFGYWVIGTLTNDLKSSARFVGIYHTTMATGGLVGFRIIMAVQKGITAVNSPCYVGIALTSLSLVSVYFVVRRIPETNDWALGKIESVTKLVNDPTDAEEEPFSNMLGVISDVKYHYHRRQPSPN